MPSLAELAKQEEERKKKLAEERKKEREKERERKKNIVEIKKPRRIEAHDSSILMKPQKQISPDDVPIDAYRGLYYLVSGKTDKKLTKLELKLNLKMILENNQEKFKQLKQSIIDIIFSE